jgi:hypothetical protein
MRRLVCLALACGVVAAVGWQLLPRHDEALYKACDHLAYDAPDYSRVKAWDAYAHTIDGWPRPADPGARAILETLRTDATRYGAFPAAIHSPRALKRQAVKNALGRDEGHLYDACRSDGLRMHVQAS